MALSDSLKSLIKGDFTQEEQTLTTYSKDASIFEIKPQAVISPKDSEDIKALVKYINSNPKEGLSLTARSAGTCMSGGSLSESIVLDMTKYFNKVIEVKSDSAITQPGVYYRDFEPKTLEKNLILPCYTSSRELNTVGGMVGNNSAGEKTLSFGQTERYVKRLKIVLSDGNEYEISPLTKEQLDKKIAQKDFEGELYKKIYNLVSENKELIATHVPQTSKNSTGYYLWKVWDEEKQIFDLNKLIVGSQGTLGIVTEIEFALIKPKLQTAMLVIELPNLDKLDKVVNKVLEYKPESFECFDDQTLRAAVKYLSEVIHDFKKTKGIGNYFKFIPEFIEGFTNKYPAMELIAEFTSDTEEDALNQAKTALEGIAEFKLKTKVIKAQEEEKYWIIRRDSFNILRHHTKDPMRTCPFMDDIIVDPKHLPQFLPRLKETMAPYKDLIIYTIAGHIGNGNFHIIPIMDLTQEKVRQVIPELSKKVFDLVFEYHGSMAAEHNDGLVRGPYLPLMYGEDVYQLMKDVKQIFDPKNIFNPHKKTDATEKYSMDHLSGNAGIKVADYAQKSS